ncbi:MAG: YeeE/YedE family protein [Plesiomonas sp.]|uniref:YeeE/YedE family protein n=1 Tax=Plesiomonas sp. TaxID=2486279 RepID=UPI003F3EE46C
MLSFSSALLGLTGGGIIGLSALLLLKSTGRIAGISGILTGLLHPNKEWFWRILFVLGMAVGALYTANLMGITLGSTVNAPLPLIVVAGLLVGFGAKLGNGCTSGHGICGMGRLSVRSIIATCTFMATGFITVYLLRHIFAG